MASGVSLPNPMLPDVTSSRCLKFLQEGEVDLEEIQSKAGEIEMIKISKRSSKKIKQKNWPTLIKP